MIPHIDIDFQKLKFYFKNRRRDRSPVDRILDECEWTGLLVDLVQFGNENALDYIKYRLQAIDDDQGDKVTAESPGDGISGKREDFTLLSIQEKKDQDCVDRVRACTFLTCDQDKKHRHDLEEFLLADGGTTCDAKRAKPGRSI